MQIPTRYIVISIAPLALSIFVAQKVYTLGHKVPAIILLVGTACLLFDYLNGKIPDKDQPVQADSIEDEPVDTPDSTKSHKMLRSRYSAFVKSSGIEWFEVIVTFEVDENSLTESELKILLGAGKIEKPDGSQITLTREDPLGILFALEKLGHSKEITKLSDRLTFNVHASQRELINHLPTSTSIDKSPPAAVETELCVPARLEATLRSYQIDGYKWLCGLSSRGLGGILADDMGLGKTVQAIAWILHLLDKAERKNSKILIICPRSVVNNWNSELSKFAKSIKASTQVKADSFDDIDLLIISFAELRINLEKLRNIDWEAIIIDEAQYIKSPTTATHMAACQLRTRHRLAMSGTPIENRLTDLWAIMNFSTPRTLGSLEHFRQRYEDSPNNRPLLKEHLKSFILRRTKQQVAIDLPQRIEENIYCDLEGVQASLYNRRLSEVRQRIDSVNNSEINANRFVYVTEILRLRQLCCDTNLVYPNSGSCNAKIEVLRGLLSTIIASGNSALVFTQFTKLFPSIEAMFREEGFSYVKLSGDTLDRAAVVNEFQTQDSVNIFLISLKAGGTGLNLTKANYVFLFDPWWNPAVEMQAIDRTHRIGQSRTVFAYRLIAKGTIEEKVQELQASKKVLVSDIFEEHSNATVDADTIRQILK